MAGDHMIRDHMTRVLRAPSTVELCLQKPAQALAQMNAEEREMAAWPTEVSACRPCWLR